MTAGILLGALALAAAGAVEPDLRPEIEVRGRLEHVEITASGELWLASTVEVYRSRDGNVSWEEAGVLPADPAGGILGSVLSRVRFFDSVRGFAVGYLGEGHQRVYRTEDGGAHWVPVWLPASLWVYDAQASADGRAWLVGSSGDLIASRDFGVTWELLTAPFDSSDRSHSVHFETPLEGIVGALSDGLRSTSDGGRTWVPLPTPKEAGLASGCDRAARIEKARLLGDRVLAWQCEGVFAGRRGPKPGWVEIRVDGKKVLDFELLGRGLVAVTEDLEVVYLDGNLARQRGTGYRLSTPPASIATLGERVAILESNGRVVAGQGAGFQASRLLGAGRATHWPILNFDRGADGTLWGASQYFVYRSRNAGVTWERIGEVPHALSGLVLGGDGRLLLWDGHGYVARFDPESRALAPVPGLSGLDVVGLFRRPDLWLAWGGRQYETMERVEVARTFFAGQFEGSVPYGFVHASVDGGRTWREIHHWDEAGVQEVFLGDDNSLALLSWRCVLERGKLVRRDDGSVSVELHTVGADPLRLENVHWLDFLGGERGRVQGSIHHVGFLGFRTGDGGRTWESERNPEQPLYFLRRLAGGRWLAVREDKELVRWDGKGFATLRTFDSAIMKAVADATGGLLVELEDGALLSLSEDGETWKQERPAAQ